MATTADLIAIAQDIAQESCLRVPLTDMTVPGQVAHWQRHGVFVAAKAVKEMCNLNSADEGEDVANLILYAALVVEYAANYFSENSHREISEPENPRCVFTSIMLLPLSRRSLTIFLSLLDKMEYIKDVLKIMEPGYDLDAKTLKADLIDALARVRLSSSHPTEICFLTSLNPTGFRRGQQPERGRSVYRVVL